MYTDPTGLSDSTGISDDESDAADLAACAFSDLDLAETLASANAEDGAGFILDILADMNLGKHGKSALESAYGEEGKNYYLDDLTRKTGADFSLKSAITTESLAKGVGKSKSSGRFDDVLYKDATTSFGPFPGKNVDFLTQKVGDVVLYPDDCIYFSLVNSVIGKGFQPTIQTDNLSKTVHDYVVSNNYKVGFSDLISHVFGISGVVPHAIPRGLSEEQLMKTIGNNPAVLIYNQSEFWNLNTLTGVHGISFYNNTYMDPYLGRSGSFGQIRGGGRRNRTSATDYRSGWYLTW